ncbi:MAG: peptide-methionine (S)-S-oxide reductase MsrA [Hyphomonadaceae bacterium]|nr:peptide-methionine (S)-S-oxide reductase MsrA [Hyphomonadaceae bacterium]MBX3510469.1 peptide-methionine (S)-S-oxide reductase MsrA [Hyphomonadaceae bacterium]
MIRALLAAFALFFATPAVAQQPRIEEAVFAGGCFWCMEHDMGAIPGVVSVESGYTGGRSRNPTYQSHEGHYEAVRVRFDASRITYAQLIERYWPLTDPTDANGQFCDRGPSYRPAIFVTETQRPIAEASRARLIESGRVQGRVITPILPRSHFTLAEEYHRNYAARNPGRYQRYRQGCGRDARLRQVWRRVR